MNNYKYIRVSLYGQFDGELRTELRYPSAGLENEPRLTVFNPTKVLDQFVSARECYALWSTAAGCCYGMVTRNPLDPASGAMLLTLVIDHGVVLTGRQVMAALTALRRCIIEEHRDDDDSITAALRGAGLPEEPEVVAELAERARAAILPADQQPKATGYRTYVSTHELETILSFPGQEDYSRYRRVLIVPATAALKAGAKLTRITAPMQRRFWVVTPAGVTASPRDVTEGERLTLTFSKPGYSSFKETLTAGIPSSYVRYDGSIIRVKAPGESGISFTRRVKINVRSAKGVAVNGYTVTVNGRQINTMEPYVELTEHDLSSGRPVVINVASSNFKPVKIEKDPATLGDMTEVDIVLEPLEQGIMLRLDFGEGRLFEEHISIERNTPEYSQLRSGNFHGFRAYRISSQGMNEAYNIDVRAAGKPTAPTFDRATTSDKAPETVTTATTKAATGGRKIPVFENISREDPHKARKEEPKKKDKTAEEQAQRAAEPAKPRKEERPVTIGIDDDDDRPSNKLGIIICVAISIILLVVAVFYFLPSSLSDTDPDAMEQAETLAGDETAPEVYSASPVAPSAASQAEPAAAAAPAAQPDAESADIKYLNENSTWRLSDLKSDKYRALYTAIVDGDIEKMAANDYFAVKNQASNFHAVEVVDMAWKSIGTDNEGGNRRALREYKDKESIDINKLYESLARRKPKSPNPNPRPSR